MKIIFYNSDSIHPPSPIYEGDKIVGYNDSGLTISEVARELEARYGIISLFEDYIKNKLIIYLQEKAFRKKIVNLAIINEWIKDEWRDWIIGNGTGIITKASIERGGQSFVDTGAYYENMLMRVKFTDKELASLNEFYNIIDENIFS